MGEGIAWSWTYSKSSHGKNNSENTFSNHLQSIVEHLGKIKQYCRPDSRASESGFPTRIIIVYILCSWAVSHYISAVHYYGPRVFKRQCK